jgi:hypothetical protein
MTKIELLFSWLSFLAIAIIIGCSSIKNNIKNNRTRDCMALCTVLEAAKCWDYGMIVDAHNFATCIDYCHGDYSVISEIDFGCLFESEGCEVLEKCIEAEIVI